MQKKTVMVGMSGGVDSSVAAAVLLEGGYEIIGVTMQIWPDSGEEYRNPGEGCCSLSAVDDARRVSDMLGIPYYVLNFREIFREKVIEYFEAEYVAGRTPNPCIACNRYVKFDALLKKAASMGIDYIATGHYARIHYDQDKRRYLLKKSITQRKDQTYVLYNMSQEQLGRTLMPIGDYTKEMVREKAAVLGLPVALKPDSQEICFVEDNDYGRFICKSGKYDILPGDFVDMEGNVLGRHKGIVHYTIGQRKGLGIASGTPMYVAGIDAESNRIILGSGSDIYSNSLLAGDLNFISVDRLDKPMKIRAKIRYSARDADATIIPFDGQRVKVVFDVPQRAVTPGQSVVFYDEDTVVGGGVIIKPLE